tara:strand:+ start:1273 stop:1539 length:267 start_codon:yes stop_codon:yes gene_type:complete
MLKDKIIALISEKINIHHIKIDDLTEKHKNHITYENGGHYKLIIISNDFTNLSLINRHRLIYKILNGLIKKEIHALSLKTLTRDEYNK